ncbi:MAG: tyrosine-type recombinase/integrase [Gammaproteobacteria bacterium]
MREYIGNSLIAKLKPEQKEYDVWDTKLIGFILRVLPSGAKVYRCEYARGKRVTLGKATVLTPAQARDKAKQILSQAVIGVLPANECKSKAKLTLKNFITNEYEAWRAANRKNGKDDMRRLRVNFLDEFGDCLLKNISPMLVEKWRTQRINNGIQSTTVNRDIVILKAALSKAVEWNLISDHPLKKLKPFKTDAIAKVRYLDKNEEMRLKEALQFRNEELKQKRENGNQWKKDRGQDCLPDLRDFVFSDYLTPMIFISLNTGLRRGELFSLTWTEVNFEHALLTVKGDTAKSGKTRHLPLNAVALKAFKDWRQLTSKEGLVFSNKNTGEAFSHVKRAWATILEKAKIKSFRWHDMRHHFASKLVMAGVDLNTVRELLGHADIKMTLRYAHLAPEHKANAVAKLVEFEP